MRKQLKDFFIPHQGNDYNPHSLQKVAVIGMMAMVLLSFAFANIQSLLWTSSQWMVSSVLPAVIVDLTNQERDTAALQTLQRNRALDEAAQLKAEHMAEKEYFAHHSPDGVSPWYWFAVANYNFAHAGENLAIHFTDSDQVVEAWMDSPTHRANIMNNDYSEIGVGTAAGEYNGYKTVYVVQLFGTPVAAPAVAGVETAADSEPDDVDVVTESLLVAQTLENPTENQTAVLAEEVIITEDVEVVAAEPVPITVVEAEEVSEVAEEVMELEVTDMEVTDTGVALFSDHVSTSTGAVPATTLPQDIQTSNQAPYVLELLTQPQVLLQILYVMIGLFVLGSLLLSILIEVRHHQPVQIAYSVALLALMLGLLYVHSALTSGATIV